MNINETANISQQLVCSNFTTGFINVNYINTLVDSTSILSLTSLVGDVTDGTTGITLNPNKIIQGYSFNTASQSSWANNISLGTSVVNNEIHNLFNQDSTLKWLLNENMLGYNEYSAISYDGTSKKATKQAHIIIPVKSSVSLSSTNKLKLTAANDYLTSATNSPPSSFQLWGIKKSGASEPTINPPYVCPGNESLQKAVAEKTGDEILYEDRFFILRDCTGNNNHGYNKYRTGGTSGDHFHSSEKALLNNNNENNCIRNKIYDALNIYNSSPS